MIVKENPTKAAAILDLAWQRNQQSREPGVHVSDLVRCLRAGWYERNGRARREMLLEDKSVLLLGQSQHVLLEPGAEAKIVVPAGLGYIHGTIDVYLPGNELFTNPTEIKTTRSDDLKQPILGMPHYIEQLATYCLGAGTLLGTLAVWYIFAMPPLLRVWDLVFSESEINGWHDELCRRLQVLTQYDIPSVDEHRKGECRYCPFYKKNKGECGGGDGREGYFYPSNYSALGA